MYLFSFAAICSFILIILESFIVMALKENSTIYFGGIEPFISIWAMNFFLAYAVLNHVKQWYQNRKEANDPQRNFYL
jgi:hypothetical protein